MKLSVMMVGLCLSMTMWAQRAPVPAPSPIPGCHAKGVSMHVMYGQKADVLRAAGRLPAELDTFRMHLFLVESGSGAEALLYEKTEAGWEAQSWKGTGLKELRSKLDAMVLRTRGSSCAGDEMKAMLTAEGVDLKPRQGVTAATLTGVLETLLADRSTGYMRVTVLDPCERAVIEGTALAQAR